MALPSSGPISFSDVAGEVGDSTTSNISLGKLSIYDLGDIPTTGYPLGSGFYGWADSDRFTQLQAAGRVGSTTSTSVANRMVVIPGDEPTPEIREISLGKPFSVNFWVKAGWSMTGANQLKNQGRYVYFFGTAANAIHPSYASNIYNNNFRVYYDALQNRFNVGFLANDSSSNPKYSTRQWVMHQLNSGGMTVTGLSTNSTSTNWWGATSRGNVNDNGFNMITVTFNGDNSFTNSNLKVYWNGGYMGTSGVSVTNGTPICDTTSARGISFLGTPFANNSAGGTFTEAAGYTGGNTGTTIIDNVSVFKSALSTSEMGDLYNSGNVGGVMPSEDDTNLIVYYSFNTNTENQTISNSRPVFPVKQGTAGYGGLQISGSSGFQDNDNQATPSDYTSFSYNSTGVNGRSGPAAVCEFETVTDTAYHDGTGTVPVSGDMVYSDSAGTTPLAIINFDVTSYTFLDSGTQKYLKISSTTAGLVTDIGSC
jgi:hypothetical protein